MQLRSIHLAAALIGIACGGCALTEGDADPAQSEDIADLSTFVLTANASGASGVTVRTSTSVQSCSLGTTCNFAFAQGTAVTLTTAQNDQPDCLHFAQWFGACAGQGATCSLTINSNLSTSPFYRFTQGCQPI